MSDMVHNRSEHVEKKRRSLHANIMSCRCRSMVGEVGLPSPFPYCIPEEDNYSDGDSEGADHAYLSPEVFALTCHADVGHIMHMAPQRRIQRQMTSPISHLRCML